MGIAVSPQGDMLKNRVRLAQGRIVSAINSISSDKLARLIGTPRCPALIDVRPKDDFDFSPRLIPGSTRRTHSHASAWASEFVGQAAVVICRDGSTLSQGTAAWLRDAGVAAEVLEYGFEAWTKAALPLLTIGRMPPPNHDGRTVWVTRSRPKVDRIACPWLIRRFIDPRAVFLFVAASEVPGVAERFGAEPFDLEGVFWSHRGDRCTFDLMVEEFGLAIEPLLRLATMVRGADTGHLELAPQAAGLLAASLGLSRMYADDLAQLEAGLALYDAFYRWCRDAVDETHTAHARRVGTS
jgi:rhodanese-related sulfurtransferase